MCDFQGQATPRIMVSTLLSWVTPSEGSWAAWHEENKTALGEFHVHCCGQDQTMQACHNGSMMEYPLSTPNVYDASLFFSMVVSGNRASKEVTEVK